MLVLDDQVNLAESDLLYTRSLLGPPNQEHQDFGKKERRFGSGINTQIRVRKSSNITSPSSSKRAPPIFLVRPSVFGPPSPSSSAGAPPSPSSSARAPPSPSSSARAPPSPSSSTHAPPSPSSSTHAPPSPSSSARAPPYTLFP